MRASIQFSAILKREQIARSVPLWPKRAPPAEDGEVQAEAPADLTGTPLPDALAPRLDDAAGPGEAAESVRGALGWSVGRWWRALGARGPAG